MSPCTCNTEPQDSTEHLCRNHYRSDMHESLSCNCISPYQKAYSLASCNPPLSCRLSIVNAMLPVPGPVSAYIAVTPLVSAQEAQIVSLKLSHSMFWGTHICPGAFSVSAATVWLLGYLTMRFLCLELPRKVSALHGLAAAMHIAGPVISPWLPAAHMTAWQAEQMQVCCLLHQ